MTEQPMPADPHLLAGAYALDALDDLERRQFENHLTTCPECTEDVRDFRETASWLGAGTTVTPPAGLRERVMAEVAVTRQLPPLSQDTDRVERPSGHLPTAARWLSAAAAVLLAATIGTGALAWQADQDADQATAQADQLATRQVDVSRILADPERVLADADVQGGGTGTVVLADGRAVFVGSGISAPPEGSQLQLWMIDDPQTFRSGGLLEGRDGTYTTVLASTGGATTFGVTVEPEGGSDQPTTDPVVVIAASASAG